MFTFLLGIYGIQWKGLIATGLLAAFGLAIIFAGDDGSSPSIGKWSERGGRCLIGGVFLIPFVAVAASVWLTRAH